MEDKKVAESMESNKNPSKLSRNRTLLIVIIVLIVAVVVGIVIKNNQSNGNGRTATIHIKNAAFVPATITVEKGTKVTWIDDDDDVTYIVAANPYPTHTSLPSLLSKGLTENEQYSYVFDKSGTFGYHNDNKPTMNGTVIVK